MPINHGGKRHMTPANEFAFRLQMVGQPLSAVNKVLRIVCTPIQSPMLLLRIQTGTMTAVDKTMDNYQSIVEARLKEIS